MPEAFFAFAQRGFGALSFGDVAGDPRGAYDRSCTIFNRGDR